MNLNEQSGTWKPDSGVFDIRNKGENEEYNELRRKAASGEIRHFKDGLKEGWTGYNQKDHEFIVVCKWWYFDVVSADADVEGDLAA